MAPRTLAEWLEWQERLHPAGIDLGLERVRTVWGRLGRHLGEAVVLTVGGTNGKGSLVAMLEAVFRRAGYRTGAYTSPHLHRYNERIRIEGREVGDRTLVEAFEAIEGVRGDMPLTFFEFGTLAALSCFSLARCEVVLLEVGLGGRLDAVNLIDTDCAVIGQVALDHQAWLGPDREAIGREKAGIFRPARPAVCADPDPPESLRRAALELGTDLFVGGEHFRFAVREGGGWDWSGFGTAIERLPPPGLPGAHQYANAATVVAVCRLLEKRLPVSMEALSEGIAEVRLPGRFEQVHRAPEVILDVAHNPAAAETLAGLLAARPVAGRTLAVFAALEDKDISGIVRALEGYVDRWHLAGLEVPRGLDAVRLGASVPEALPATLHASVAEALAAALEAAGPEDRVLVFGSFYTVAAAGVALPDILSLTGRTEDG